MNVTLLLAIVTTVTTVLVAVLPLGAEQRLRRKEQYLRELRGHDLPEELSAGVNQLHEACVRSLVARERNPDRVVPALLVYTVAAATTTVWALATRPTSSDSWFAAPITVGVLGSLTWALARRVAWRRRHDPIWGEVATEPFRRRLIAEALFLAMVITAEVVSLLLWASPTYRVFTPLLVSVWPVVFVLLATTSHRCGGPLGSGLTGVGGSR